MGQYYYMPVDQPNLDDIIARHESSFSPLSTKYTTSEIDTIKGYTFIGDRFVNNLLRNDSRPLNDLVNLMLDRYSFPFARQMYDMYEYLEMSKLKELPPKESLLISPKELFMLLSESNMENHETETLSDEKTLLNMVKIEAIIRLNKDFFSDFPKMKPIIWKFFTDLINIFKKAPKLKGPIKVYRGSKTEYYDTLNYISNGFMSTSVNPYVALNFADTNADFKGSKTGVFYSVVYEITVMPGVPLLYLEPLTKIKSEYEILLPPSLLVETSPYIIAKKIVSTKQLALERTVRLTDSKFVYTIPTIVKAFIEDTPIIQKYILELEKLKETIVRRRAAAISRIETKALGETIDKVTTRRSKTAKSNTRTRRNITKRYKEVAKHFPTTYALNENE